MPRSALRAVPATLTRVRPTGRRAVAATIAAALAMGTVLFSSAPAQAATAAETAAATSVFNLLNTERAANRLPVLGRSAALVSSARSHNLAMAAANSMSHQVAGEASLGTRITRVGVVWHSIAENIGYNSDHSTAGANALEQMMYNETAPNNGHRLNILSTAVRYIGVDIYVDARGRLWLTEDFADAPGPVAVTPPAAYNPVGHLDSVTAAAGHQAVSTGWAMDPDNRSQPLYIALYVDGVGRHWWASGVARPDVARVMHAGPNQGFRIAITLTAGRHTVCTYAINIARGTGNPRLGCLVVVT